MKDSTVLVLIFIVYSVITVAFYVVTAIKLGRPFLIPLVTILFEGQL